ncbi:MAG: hypothetical protein K0R55_1699 [Sporomusa sp.]|nr:hypothetical protein [Sporomusa sp.]
MFERTAAGETGIIARGLLILLLIIVIGVGVAEHQLTTLTQRPEQERFFYIGRNQEHVYSAYVFGYGLTLGSVYSLGNISLTDRNFMLKFAGHTITIPTKVEVDGSRLYHWLFVWHRQFVEEAFATKKKSIEYWNQAKPYIENISQTIRDKSQYAIQQMSEYIREYR